MHSLLLVLVRCDEPLSPVLKQLRSLPFPYLIYQKVGGGCNRHALPDSEASRTRLLPLNIGRECIGYLQYITDEYTNLPPAVAFLQWGAETHMPFRGLGLGVNLHYLVNSSAGFVALSKNTFEGVWPAPCEPASILPAFASCSDAYWWELTTDGPLAGSLPPRRLRFFANGIFAVTAERIRQHPRSFYRELLSRLSGDAPLRCVDGKAYRAFHNRNSSGIVKAEVDCLVLEKLWHVMFGEPAMLPAPE
ncbi:MAG: hypothetical protein SGPRY_013479, partial [Prymnesium sp.]